MINVSYNLSSRLKENLSKIDSLRARILLTPLPPKKQLQLRFKATVDRIYYSLRISGNLLKRGEMVKLLTAQVKRRLTKQEQEVIKYRNAVDYIRQNWLVNESQVLPKTVIILHEIACYGKLRLATSDVKRLLDYLQAKTAATGTFDVPPDVARSENPVIKAAIVNLAILNMRPFNDGNGRLARLLTLLFLYKYGYDFNGLLALEKKWAQNQAVFSQNYQIATRASSITLWLEYFTKVFISELEEILSNMTQKLQIEYDVPALFFDLNDRQKSILMALEQPGANITNKKVQKIFKVSQITASRYLTKLKALGLLNSYGKGRSIYYTKA